jgi:hypothetical protein
VGELGLSNQSRRFALSDVDYAEIGWRRFMSHKEEAPSAAHDHPHALTAFAGSTQIRSSQYSHVLRFCWHE